MLREPNVRTDGWAQGSENLQLNNIHDLVLIRFADVLLMQSELKENTDGINRVRERAGLSPISSYSLQALQNERRWELAFESIRWNDIRRWHIAAAALEKQTNVKIYTNGQEDSNKAHGVATPHDITLPPDSSRYRRARWICRTQHHPERRLGRFRQPI